MTSLWSEIFSIVLSAGGVVVLLGFGINLVWSVASSLRWESATHFFNLCVQFGVLIAVIYLYGAKLSWVAQWAEFWGQYGRPVSLLSFFPPTALFAQGLATLTHMWLTTTWRHRRLNAFEDELEWGLEDKRVDLPQGLTESGEPSPADDQRSLG